MTVHLVACGLCRGSGEPRRYTDPDRAEACPRCGGTGLVSPEQNGTPAYVRPVGPPRAYRRAIREGWPLDRAEAELDPRNLRRYVMLWTWGAGRWSEPYASEQDRWHDRHGIGAYRRRRARAQRIGDAIAGRVGALASVLDRVGCSLHGDGTARYCVHCVAEGIGEGAPHA